jgi:hypothetical protein
MLVRQIAGFLIAVGAACGADPQLMNLAMPDAKVLAGVNVTTAKTSPLGQFVFTQMQSSVPQLQNAITATGFDPFTDVTEVLVAGTADPAKPVWLVLMDGNFKVSQIVTALQGQAGQGGKVQTYAGATLISFAPPNSKSKITPALAFIGTGIALAGDAPTVEAALDRANGSNSVDPALAARAAALGLQGDAWLVSIAPIGSLLSGGVPAAPGGMAQVTQMLSSIQSFSGAMKLGDNVQLAAQAVASSDKNAEALGNVARMIVSLGAMNAAKDPQMAGMMQVLQNLQISTSGTDVNLALAVPEAQVEGLLKSFTTPGKLPNGN